MIRNFDLTKILNKALAEGGEYAEIFFEDSLVTSIICEDNRMEKIISGQDIGVGVRLISNFKTYYAFSNEVTEAKLLELAGVVAKGGASKEAQTVHDITVRSPKKQFSVKEHSSDAMLAEKITLVERGNKAARGYNDSISQARVVYGDFQRRVVIANSAGDIAPMDKEGILFLVQVVAGADDVIQTGYEPLGGIFGMEIFEEHPPEKIAEEAARRAMLMLKAPRAPAGEMPVVMSAEAGGTMVHEAIGHGLESDEAQIGMSVYSDKIGEKVAAGVISVADDATMSNLRGSYSFDDEGVPAGRTVLVENGILKGYLYDRLSALKDGVSSTGNGRRQSYAYVPVCRMSNTLILPGKDDPEAIIGSVDKGLLVKKMGGGQVNPVSGEFVFEVSEGYLLEKGQVGEPVRGATITGNGPEILEKIDMVGNDLGFSIGTCGKRGQGVPVSDAQPTIRIPEIVVGGEVK